MKKQNPKKIAQKITRKHLDTPDDGALHREKSLPKSIYQEKKCRKLEEKSRKMPRAREPKERSLHLNPLSKRDNSTQKRV